LSEQLGLTYLIKTFQSALLGICQPEGQMPLCFAFICEEQEMLLQSEGNAIAVDQL
jgi:hypothetical protein